MKGEFETNIRAVGRGPAKHCRKHCGRMWLAMVIAVLAGCGGPGTAARPSSADAVAEFRQLFAERMATMLQQPATARQELDLVTEALAGKAETYGEPFAGWLDRVREVGEGWGAKPQKAIVRTDLEGLQNLFAAPVDPR